MLDSVRKPFFWAALAVLAVAVSTEVGAAGFVSAIPVKADEPPAASLGIPYCGITDGLLLYIVLLQGLSMLVTAEVLGRIQGVLTFVVTLLLIVLGIIMIMAAFVKLILMVSLLMAVPFGTIVYLGAFGTFPKAAAAVALSSSMVLKMVFAVLLFLAHQTFLKNRGLMVLLLLSFLGSIIVSFLHGFVPVFLVSITDAVAALVCAILGVILALYHLVRSIPAVSKAIA